MSWPPLLVLPWIAASTTLTDQIAGLPSQPVNDIPSKICFIPGGTPKPPSVDSDPSTSPFPASSAVVPPVPEPVEPPALPPPPPLLPVEDDPAPPEEPVLAPDVEPPPVAPAPPVALVPALTELGLSEQPAPRRTRQKRTRMPNVDAGLRLTAAVAPRRDFTCTPIGVLSLDKVGGYSSRTVAQLNTSSGAVARGAPA